MKQFYLAHLVPELEAVRLELFNWLRDNFASSGDISILHQTMGISEEVGELGEHCSTIDFNLKDQKFDETVEHLKDDLGDIMNFSLNLVSVIGCGVNNIIQPATRSFWEMSGTLMLSHCHTSFPFNFLLGLQIFSSKVSHHALKMSQGIRSNENHIEGIKINLNQVWRFVYLISILLNSDIVEITKKISNKVMKRNWVEDPNLGGENEY
jgi:hypothetical protein